jgi:hypothetical protein
LSKYATVLIEVQKLTGIVRLWICTIETDDKQSWAVVLLTGLFLDLVDGAHVFLHNAG